MKEREGSRLKLEFQQQSTDGKILSRPAFHLNILFYCREEIEKRLSVGSVIKGRFTGNASGKKGFDRKSAEESGSKKKERRRMQTCLENL